jgi:thiol:disulfide interchange protein DsbD
MVAVGLNLFGVFEMGTSVMNMAGSAAGRIHSGGYAGSFWSGMLATAIATPCSAPFMAPAVGYAVTAPAIESLLLFTFLGAGMALPYVLLTANPRLLKKVPRPGPWMETFKRVLAFPMFGVAAWLVGVVGAQTGVDGVEWLLYGLVVLGIGLWIYGHWGTPERPTNVRRVVGYGLALLVIACAVVLMVLACLQEPQDAVPFVEGDDVTDELPIGPPTEMWQDWSPSLVRRYLKAGHPVFVDYTAKWCLSCKTYEGAALYRDEFEELVQKHQVATLKADYTVRTSARGRAILQSLKSFGRSGVPLYVVYSPAPNSKPETQDYLTPQLALDMVTRAATQPGVPIRTASLPPSSPEPGK